ncbi:MAG: tRNA (N6-isopentenyl adenosine(37)-C2)-methylthiotransferase MiaB [Bacteroidales bacterium]|jgi:tRNA-2-methylthio-N6-dimethylallyladenosine synthase|nr:tRNA (N6-isopentenyl adenosine(37)-C2)-methylthiotransferase MiaB [Bacteroidales bacterium]MDD3755336.1 tRNA (N6-isopentenyl adenosine(37)-C2)-methylthiotransferase MiaB [Bacteroidales bacterium]MDI9575317.1 tRNA (N6-isopentenyl adenosine(37)-C2)-methylthiotransferase MiaB [Bacteroidota bacterium]HHW59698.1 tRNA (N6-isopentenyl adenosine(37)-C2)-methylthiotransferase MiaB [Bacteroidales bacterium]
MMKTFYVETYGCQMNVVDSEIVASILIRNGLIQTYNPQDADIILLNTCSIRENAEMRIKSRIKQLGSFKKTNPNLRLGIIGCMAENLKEKLFVELPQLDLLAGPDVYRLLPEILKQINDENKIINTTLSKEETYADVLPFRYDSNGISAYVSIMRGCDNFCSYCVVPYTRGRERSRDASSIINEVLSLSENGFKEITLLGQNVNSYHYRDIDFPALISLLAKNFPNLLFRFTTSHPKDLSIELIEAMASFPNIAKSIHLPVQSGSNEVLKRMNRKYTRDDYLEKVYLLRRLIPDITISTDIICGFCGETEEDHLQTIDLMKEVNYFFAFMFKYNERPNTLAAKKYADDVTDDIKSRRLKEIIDLQQKISYMLNKQDIGKIFKVLVEGISKKNEKEIFGRNSQNKVIVFAGDLTQKGQFVDVEVTNCTSATLIGRQNFDK